MAKAAQQGEVSQPTLRRLPGYLGYLKEQESRGLRTISATAVAAAMGLHEVQVRKDLSSVSGGGRPKTGYCIRELIGDLEEFLGYRSTKEAILVGVGHLGSALLSFKGFGQCGMQIVAAFDNDPEKIGRPVSGIPVYHVRELPAFCHRARIRIGILTTRPEHAQTICDAMVEGGILVIWNFSTALLRVPEKMIVHNENLAVSLAMISHALEQTIGQETKEETACSD